MNLQILNTIQNITREEDQNLKDTISNSHDGLQAEYNEINTNLQSNMISKMEEKITDMKTTHEENNETINNYKKAIKDNEQSSIKYMSNNEKEETNNRYFTYMLYVSIVYLVVLVLSLLYFQMNQDVLKIFLIISIILYISQYLLSEYFGREYFTDDEESSLMKYRKLIYKYVKSGTAIINSNFDELSGILDDEGKKKKKQYNIEKVNSKYQSDKSRSTYNTMTHSTEYLKDISELLYVLIVLSLISLLLKEYINNVALISAMMVPILLFVFLTYFLRMNRRTNSQYNQMYW
jgi:cation transport ATPase